MGNVVTQAVLSSGVDMTHSTEKGDMRLGYFSRKGEFVGLKLMDEKSVKEFIKISCPCGVVAKFSPWDFPKVSTLHPCGVSDHWTVRYDY